MKAIVPHLWFDDTAREAATFYTSLFDASGITSSTVFHNTPSGDTEVIRFNLSGHPFEAISAGPYFNFNPTISLMVSLNSAQEVDALWRALSEGGTPLMPLGGYPFSPRYGWIQDRYGLSWQLILQDDTPGHRIRPSLLFSGDACGRAEEAMAFYTGLFEDSAIESVSRYDAGEAVSPAARVKYASFRLLGEAFVAMDNATGGDFAFSEASSLIVYCDTQQEIDDLWDKLSAVPEAESCGWLKDRFGVSWQVVPRALPEMLSSGDDAGVQRVTKAFLQMKKFDIAALQRAFRGE